MKQRRRSPAASMLLVMIVPYLLFPCSCAVAVSTDRQASTSIRQQQDESNPIYDRLTATMTVFNDLDVAVSSPLGKDSQREQLQRHLEKSQKRKRQPRNFDLAGYTDTGKSYSSKSSKATVSPAPSVSFFPSASSVPSSKPSESSTPSKSSRPSITTAPSQVPSLTPSESSAPSKSSQPSLSTAPSQVPSTSRYGKSSKARY